MRSVFSIVLIACMGGSKAIPLDSFHRDSDKFDRLSRPRPTYRDPHASLAKITLGSRVAPLTKKNNTKEELKLLEWTYHLRPFLRCLLHSPPSAGQGQCVMRETWQERLME